MALIEEECKRYRPTKDYLAYLEAPNYDAFMVSYIFGIVKHFAV